MKYRIVERKWRNGDKYYLVQYRVLWLWLSYKIDKVYVHSYDCQNIFRRKIAFGDIEEAKEALERTQRKYEHSGIRIYPTTDKFMFYSLLGAKRHEKYGWYVNLICGSYDSCCKQIDEYLAAKKNRKYKKIIEL